MDFASNDYADEAMKALKEMKNSLTAKPTVDGDSGPFTPEVKMTSFVVKMRNFVLKMMNFVLKGGRAPAEHARVTSTFFIHKFFIHNCINEDSVIEHEDSGR